MKLAIFLQALQIMTFKNVEGWRNTDFEYKLVSAGLIFMAISLFSTAGNQVPGLDESNQHTGVILRVRDGGRHSRQSLALDDGVEIKRFAALGFTDEVLEPLTGREATVFTYDAHYFLWLNRQSLLAIEIDGQLVADRTRDVQRNSSRFAGGFRFFAKGLLLVVACLYLGLVHKLYKGKIIVRGKSLVWAESIATTSP